ncbi:MAG TPA: DUF3040 domain-containing protein [Acidimicrobiales bacterium]
MRDPQVRLTEEEQRRLAALEAALCAEDPRLARRFRTACRIPGLGVVLAAVPPARGTYATMLVVIGAVAVIATFTSLFAVAVAGLVVMALGSYLGLTAPGVRARLRAFGRWLRTRSSEARSDT